MKSIYKTEHNYNDKPNILLLYVGLFLFIFGYIFNFFLTGVDIYNQPIAIEILKNSKLFSLIYVALFVPIIEEIGFRAWQFKSYFYKILGIGLILAFIYFSKLEIYIIIPIYFTLLYLILYKPNKKRRIYGVIFTSFIFGLLHWKNYNVLELQINAFIILFGFALILNYLTWRFSLIWAILLHILNNLLGLMFYNRSDVTFETEKFRISTHNTFFCDNYNSEFWTLDSLKYCGLLYNFPELYIDKYLNDSNFIFKYNSKIAKINTDFSVNFLDTTDETFSIVLDHILNKYGFQLDSIQYPLYHLAINNNDTLDLAKNLSEYDYFVKDLSFVKYILARNYGLVFANNKADNKVLVKLPFDIINNFDNKYNEDSVIIFLKMNNSVDVYKDTSKSVNVIFISAK